MKLKLPGKENNQFLAGQIEPGVKNCKLFEGVSPSSCNLAGINLNPKNAHRANKSYFLQVHQVWFNATNLNEILLISEHPAFVYRSIL